MPVIQVNEQQYALKPGHTRLGNGAGVDVPLGGDGSAGVQAIVEVASGTAVIRRGSAVAVIKVNGVVLGVEPTPLMHGDKLEIGGTELLFYDDDKSGATQYVTVRDATGQAQKRTGSGRATAATGGRLVSLVDGKEYSVPATGITIGRDAGAGVVVAQNEVSRRHAEVVPAGDGYVVNDLSTNGVYVNGTRVDKTLTLSRADVIRVGSEEFRFYADVPVPPAVRPAPAAATEVQSAIPYAPAPARDVVPKPAPSMSGATPSARPPAPAPAPPSSGTAPPPFPPVPVREGTDTRPVIATLEIINEGLNKGKKFELRQPLTHVGRGQHNEVVIADESVSDTHAKLQRRDDGWYIVDQSSTNGTYIGGTRVHGERKIEGAPDVRFGGVKMTFRPLGGAVQDYKGTLAIASVVVGKGGSRVKVETPSSAAAAAGPAPPPEEKRGGIPPWIWVIVVLVIVGAAIFIMKG